MFKATFSTLANIAALIGLGSSYDNTGIEQLAQHSARLGENIYYYSFKLEEGYTDKLVNKFKELSIQGQINVRDYQEIRNFIDSEIKILIFGQKEGISNLDNKVNHVYYFKLEAIQSHDKDGGFSPAIWVNIICKALEDSISNNNNGKFNIAVINIALNNILKSIPGNSRFKDVLDKSRQYIFDSKNINAIAKDGYLNLNHINLEDLSSDNLLFNKLHVLNFDNTLGVYPEYLHQYIEKFKPKSVNSDLSGLSNLGNTCFINCLLQNVLNLPKFKEMLFDVEKNYIKDSLPELFIKFLREYNSKSSKNNQRALVEKIWSLKNYDNGNMFPTRCTGDSAELLGALLASLIDKDLIKEKQGDVEALINNLFNVKINSYAKHPESQDILSETQENCLGLDVPISRPNTEMNKKLKSGMAKDRDGFLRDELDIFPDLYTALQEGYFKGNMDEYTTEWGDKLENLPICKKIAVMPEILIINLKRYYQDRKNNTPTKIYDHVKSPFKLDMRQYLEDAKIPAEYKLNGIIMHHGEGYHYTAYIKRADSWHHCNDAHSIKVLTEEELDRVLTDNNSEANPYILFYVKKNPRNVINAKKQNVFNQDSIFDFIEKNIEHKGLRDIIIDELNKSDLSGIQNITGLKNAILEILKAQIEKFFDDMQKGFYANYLADEEELKEKSGTMHFCYSQNFIDSFLISVIKLKNTYPFIVITSKNNSINKENHTILSIAEKLHEVFIKPSQDVVREKVEKNMHQ